MQEKVFPWSPINAWAMGSTAPLPYEKAALSDRLGSELGQRYFGIELLAVLDAVDHEDIAIDAPRNGLRDP